jgi:hypothetical protein
LVDAFPLEVTPTAKSKSTTSIKCCYYNYKYKHLPVNSMILVYVSRALDTFSFWFNLSMNCEVTCYHTNDILNCTRDHNSKYKRRKRRWRHTRKSRRSKSTGGMVYWPSTRCK